LILRKYLVTSEFTHMIDSPRSATFKDEWPNSAKGYKILNAVGNGYFGVVWKAEVLDGRHKAQHVAIKKLDLEKCGNAKIDDIRKNILLLNLLNHTNILSYKTAFISSKDLWIVTELMEGGSVDRIMQHAYPNGLKDQALIATILKETLQGLKYLHQNNQIHRDIKAGNILIGSDGSVKISDFGVAAKLKEGKKRNTFIGSPCWMAPEVLEQTQKNGYDSKIDIWSLGITALELAHGKPPNSELTTMKLILKTLNEEPPMLDSEPCWDEHFREFISLCLVKDPLKRKSADDLMKCCKSFFSRAKGKEYIKEKLFTGLPALESRVDKKVIEATNSDQCQSKAQKCNLLDFRFQFEDREQLDNQMVELVDNFKVQISKPNLLRLNTDILLKRPFSSSNENEKGKEPQSAGSKLTGNYFDQKENFDNKPSQFATQKQKSEKILVCKGDLTNEFNFLAEEET